MRTLRMYLAGTVTLALLGSLSMTALAQDREAAVTSVTGTAVTSDSIESDGRVVLEQDVDWSDPRLPATLRVEANWGGYGSGLETVMTVEMSLLLEDAALSASMR